MSENQLPVSVLEKLRSQNVITSNEVAFQMGDLLVAENVLDRSRRVLGKKSEIIKEGKRVLKG